MSWPNFLVPAWGWMGLLALPLVALYLLRQKRPDLTISSTLLWSRALADMRASTPFQKLRRNLLLLLQLLILAALVLALMRPVVQASAGQSKAGVLVIDATASMQTSDGGGGGVTRIEHAKAEATKLVDAMRPGDQYMLVVDGGGLNHGGIGFSSSKAELRTEIDKIRASDTSSDLFESLLLAATSLRGIGSENGKALKTDAVTAGKVWLFSDGAGIRVPDAMGEDLLQFVKIGDSDHSVGITRLSITPVPKEERAYEVFVGVKNAWNVERKIGVALAYGTRDNFLPGQAKFVTVPARGEGGVIFDKVVSDPGKLFVRVDDTNDDFPLDNVGYGLLEPARKVKVLLVTAGGGSGGVLENFIRTAVRVGAIDGQIVAPEAYSPTLRADLVILDGVVPTAAAMPTVDTLIIRPQVKGAGDIAGFNVTAEVEKPVVLRWNREDPLMQYVELGDLRLSKALLLGKDPEMIPIVSSPESALIAYKDFGTVRRYFVAFSPTVESNWWMQPSLLIFLQNLIGQTQTRHYIGMPQLLASGTAAKLWDVGNETGGGTVRITRPDGSVVEIPAMQGAAEFAETDAVGFYEVSAGSRKSTFAVNLLSPTESDIRPQSLQTPPGNTVQESTGVATVNKEIWQWLAVGALAVLLLEWWVYHRRIA
jgi:Ca-activated chloride channel family protein